MVYLGHDSRVSTYPELTSPRPAIHPHPSDSHFHTTSQVVVWSSRVCPTRALFVLSYSLFPTVSLNTEGDKVKVIEMKIEKGDHEENKLTCVLEEGIKRKTGIKEKVR